MNWIFLPANTSLAGVFWNKYIPDSPAHKCGLRISEPLHRICNPIKRGDFKREMAS